MAESVPNGLSIQQDELAELRAKKQRQLASATPTETAVLQAAASVPQVPAEETAPAPAPSDLSAKATPQTSVEQSTTAAQAAKERRPRAASARPDRDGQVIISGYFPAETRRRLKIVAARQDKTLQQVMTDAFEAWLKRHDKEG